MSFGSLVFETDKRGKHNNRPNETTEDLRRERIEATLNHFLQ